jgi:ATP-dependent Clp protease ATP-binding subunit ClpA
VVALFVAAQRHAAALRHDWVGTEHVLLAMLDDRASVAGLALRRLGLETEVVRTDIMRIVGEGPPRGAAFDADALRAVGIDLDAVQEHVDTMFGEGALDRAQRARGRCGAAAFGVAPRLKQALERAHQDAERSGSAVTDEHVLLALWAQRDSVAARIFQRHEIGLRELRTALGHARDTGS